MTISSKTIAAVMVGLVLACGASAQFGPGLDFEPQSDGLTVSGAASGQFFRMRITGKDAGRLRTKRKYWFRADGVKFEFFSEENSRFLMTDLPRRLDDRVVLELYRSAFLRRNATPDIRSKRIKLRNGMTALFWSYGKFVATPSESKADEREMFLIVAGPGHVFGLFASVPHNSTERATRDLLARTLGTLSFRDEIEN